MKPIVLFFLFLLITISSYSQNGVVAFELNKKDSLELMKFYKQFKQKFDKKDTRALHRLSLKQVECDLSLVIRPHNIERGIHYISIDTFLVKAYKNLAESKFWHIEGYTIKYYHPPNLKLKKSEILKIYQVWYDLPGYNQEKENYTGTQYAFEFVRVNNEFKFFGFTDLP